jgi:hypothetical protein
MMATAFILLATTLMVAVQGPHVVGILGLTLPPLSTYPDVVIISVLAPSPVELEKVSA